MHWAPLAMVTAFSTAVVDALLKARFSSLSPGTMAVVRATSPLPFLLPLLISMEWPELPQAFWLDLSMLLPLEIAALLLYMRALKVSPLSLSIPYLAFTPVFITLTGWMLLGEEISPQGLAGIILVAAGAWLLHYRPRGGVTGPVRSMLKEQGSWLMLLVAAIYSITSVLGKQAVLNSSPIFFACFYFVLLSLVVPMAVGMIEGPWGRRASRGFRGIKMISWAMDAPWAWTAVGLAQSVMVLTHMWAISLTNAAYMIAIKRTSLLFSVIFGGLLFKERDMKRRFTGAAVMVSGTAIILIWS